MVIINGTASPFVDVVRIRIANQVKAFQVIRARIGISQGEGDVSMIQSAFEDGRKASAIGIEIATSCLKSREAIVWLR